MDKNLDDLDNLDFFEDEHKTQAEVDLEQEISDNNNVEDNLIDNEEANEENETEEEVDLITAYLQSKGIDATSVKMQNADGDTEEYNFNDLTREEQLQLLNYNPAEQEGPELADDEARLLGVLRQNNMSVQDYLNAYKRHVIEQYQAVVDKNTAESFSVDDYTDEELFVADLKDKVPDLTEQEALDALEAEQQNPTLFAKKIAGLRESYQTREREVRQQEAYEQQQIQAQQAAQYEQVIVNTIQNNNSIDLGDTSLELSEDDMNEIASFILDSDAAGVRHIAKALNDPKMLVEMAWWALKGHDALSQVTQYYKKQISDARKSARATAAPSKPKPTTVVTKPSKRQSESKSVTNEFDLYDNLV